MRPCLEVAPDFCEPRLRPGQKRHVWKQTVKELTIVNPCVEHHATGTAIASLPSTSQNGFEARHLTLLSEMEDVINGHVSWKRIFQVAGETVENALQHWPDPMNTRMRLIEINEGIHALASCSSIAIEVLTLALKLPFIRKNHNLSLNNLHALAAMM